MTSILLIEDDPGIGRFVSRGLEAEGYAVRWLRGGAQARAALDDGVFAAVILDLGLPDADGLDLCSSLRSGGVDTPILMLTARGGLDDKLDGFRSGADDYLAKPFAFEELVARLKVLARRGRNAAAPLTAGALRLDPAARTAEVGDRRLTLPPREFDLLACLARSAGAPVERQAILHEVWGPGAEVSDNAVDVYVGYLRRRLAQVPQAPRIRTVRGVGFELT